MIVYVRGLNEREDAIKPLLAKLCQLPELASAKHYAYSTDISPFSRGADLAQRGDELAVAISNYCGDGDEMPTNIVLMAHSIGGLLLRRAFLTALDDPDQVWATHVTRIVLFAAPNRGIETKVFGPIRGRMVSLVLSISRGWAAAGALRGAPFLSDLRIRWIRRFRSGTPDLPLVVQIRGTSDNIVKEDADIDLQAMPNSLVFKVYGADHQTILDPARPLEDRPGEQFDVIRRAVAGDLSDEPGLGAEHGDAATQVVFLLHGIRAGIFGWVGRLQEVIRKASPQTFFTSSSYGYLSARKFMLPWGHDRQLRAFADWYCDALSQYPRQTPHFVGHSNGTYIFGRSLQRVPAMMFDRVYLAGSVLPRDFAWADHRDQVTTVVNACGRTDVPVGILCSALRGVGRRDLGVGGFTGFDLIPVDHQFVTLLGGHGAGLEDPRLAGVASYMLTGTVPPSPGPAANDAWATGDAGSAFSLLSRGAPVLAFLLALGIGVGVVAAALWQLWLAVTIVGVLVVVLFGLSVA